MFRYTKTTVCAEDECRLTRKAPLLSWLRVCACVLLCCSGCQTHSYATLPRPNNILAQTSGLPVEQEQAASQWIHLLNPLRTGMQLSVFEAQLVGLVQRTLDEVDKQTGESNWRSYRLDTYWSLVITLNEAQRVSSLTLVPYHQ